MIDGRKRSNGDIASANAGKPVPGKRSVATGIVPAESPGVASSGSLPSEIYEKTRYVVQQDGCYVARYSDMVDAEGATLFRLYWADPDTGIKEIT